MGGLAEDEPAVYQVPTLISMIRDGKGKGPAPPPPQKTVLLSKELVCLSKVYIAKVHYAVIFYEHERIHKLRPTVPYLNTDS